MKEPEQKSPLNLSKVQFCISYCIRYIKKQWPTCVIYIYYIASWRTPCKNLVRFPESPFKVALSIIVELSIKCYCILGKFKYNIHDHVFNICRDTFLSPFSAGSNDDNNDIYYHIQYCGDQIIEMILLSPTILLLLLLSLCSIPPIKTERAFFPPRPPVPQLATV